MNRFDFPDLCCRCTAQEATQTWGVQSHESKGGPGNSIVTVTYTAPVPVCSGCHRSLSALWLCCWFAAACVGAVSGWFIYNWAIHRPNAHTFPDWLQIGVPILLGVMIAWGAAWMLKAAFINYDFAYFDPDGQTMVFKNKQYQQIFDQVNNIGGRSWGS